MVHSKGRPARSARETVLGALAVFVAFAEDDDGDDSDDDGGEEE